MLSFTADCVYNVFTAQTIFTVYALFGDDIRLAWAPVSSDITFYALSVIALILFTMELVINWVGPEKAEYRWQFYFFIDLIATLSLLPDIPWIWEPLMGLFSSGGTSQLGASTKLVRVVRLVRIIRMGKLLKMMSAKNKDQSDEAQAPSKVGETMAEMTLRRVILLVFLLILALPMFDGGLDQTINQYQRSGLEGLHHIAQLAQDYNQTGYVNEAIFHKNFDVSQQNNCLNKCD